jgi:hypothetical protein
LITTSLSSSFSANIHIGFLQTNLFAAGLLLASEKFDANICVPKVRQFLAPLVAPVVILFNDMNIM